MFLQSLRISTRVYALACLEFLLLVLVGGVALIQMQKIGTELIDIAEEDIPITNAVTQIAEHQLQQAVLFERALAVGVAEKNGIATGQNLSQIKSDFEALAHKVEKEFKEAELKVETGIEAAHSPEAVTEFRALLSSLKRIDVEHTEYDRSAIELLNLLQNGQIQEVFSRATAVIALEDKIDHALIDAQTRVQEFTLQAALKAERDELAAQKLILTLFIVAVVLSIVLPLIISRAITQPVNSMRDRLQELTQGDGDLRVRLDDSSADETGDAARAFNQLLLKLSEMVKTISSTSEQLCERSERTVKDMDNTLNSVDHQQQETEMVATAVEEMAATVAEVAKTTEKAADLGLIVRERVAEGMDAAVESQAIMQRLSEDVSGASDVISSLASETNRITEVLDAIRGIAEQTNLLALNAAIEAARAGESGRGFAVVADEVRSLAQRTQSSTQDIQALLESLQQQASQAVQTMEVGQNNAISCLEKASATASALDAGKHAVEEIADLNAQIASASDQQASVAREINVNLLRITDVATETSSGAQRTADSSQSMARALNELRLYMGQFKV